MKLQHSLKVDLGVRSVGAALLLAAVVLLATLPARGGGLSQPTTAEALIVLCAIFAGSVGASFIVVGGQLFQSAAPPHGREDASRGVARDG